MATKEDLTRLFQQLGTSPALSTFEDRLRIQKIVYLAEEAFKIDLGFRFTWYINGPYSPDLARVMFGKETGEPSNLDEKKISEMKAFTKSFIESSEQLELVGSLHYLLELAKREGKTSEYAVDLLQKLKSKFSKAEIQKYLPTLTTL